MDEDPQMGGMDKAVEKAMQADPEFFFAKVVMATMEAQGNCLILISLYKLFYIAK